MVRLPRGRGADGARFVLSSSVYIMECACGDTLQPRALDLFCCAGGATRGLQQAGFHVTGIDIRRQPRYCGDAFIQADALRPPVDLTRFDFIWASPPCQKFTALRFMPTAREHPDLIPQTRALLVAAGVPYCIENVEGAPLGESGYLIMLCGTMFGLQTADGRAELRRHRLFETSFSIPLRPKCQHGHESLSVTGTGMDGNKAAWERRAIARRNALTVCGHTPVDNTGRRDTINVCGERTPIGSRRGAAERQINRRAMTVTGNTPQTNTERNRVRQTFSINDAREAMGINWMTMAGLSQAIPPAYAEFIGREALDHLRFPASRASA